MMKSVETPISLAGSHLGRGRHICAFFHHADEEYRTLLPFIKAGFECGDRAFHVVEPKQREQHLDRLESAGINLAGAANGQFKLLDWHDTCFQHDHFEQFDIVAFLEEQLKEGARRGFRVSRSVVHMGWGLEDRPSLKDLLEYESRLSYILRRYNDPVICVYDLAKSSGAIVAGALRTHPTVLIGGILHENPFFVPSDESLRELRERTARQPTR